MICDILTPWVSTIVSKSGFSAGDRIITKWRSSMPTITEMRPRLKDCWLQMIETKIKHLISKRKSPRWWMKMLKTTVICSCFNFLYLTYKTLGINMENKLSFIGYFNEFVKSQILDCIILDTIKLSIHLSIHCFITTICQIYKTK